MSFQTSLRYTSTTVLLFIFLSLFPVHAQPPVAADVIVVIDESGSMSGEQQWLREAIPLLEESLIHYGIGSEAQENNYGLIGFGSGTVIPRSLLINEELLGNAVDFTTAANGLLVNGGTEDGWRGIDFALKEYPRRNGAALNIILATDEDRDNTDNSITFQTILDGLSENRALLNAVLDVNLVCGNGTKAFGMDSQGTGYVADDAGSYSLCDDARAVSGSGSTVGHYVDLAVENGGAVWDLGALRAGGYTAQSFTKALLAIKVDEILNQRPNGNLVAVAQATPNPAIAGQNILIDGSNSYHLVDGRSIITWEWDLDNDGTYDVSGPVISTSFNELGEYPVTLRVVDNSLEPQVATATILIDVNTPPLRPTANAGGPYLFCPQTQPWRLDGRGSANPDDGLSEIGQPSDQITHYAWDLDNDLTFDDETGSFPDVTAQLEQLGTGDHLVRLQVTDNTAQAFPNSGQDNLSDVSVTQISIRDASDLLCNCISDLAARPKATKVQLTWSDTGAARYAVYRSEVEGGPYDQIGATDNRYSTYLDLGLELDTTYYYVVEELNAAGRSVCRSREIYVTPTARRINTRNRPPAVTSTPINLATEGEEYYYDVDARDPDRGNVLAYSLQVAPSGMSIDTITGEIHWTPINAQVGEHAIVVKVSDSQGAAIDHIFNIRVANVNQAPVLSGTPLSLATELEAYHYTAIGIDADLGDQLSYSLTMAPAGMSIHSVTGELTWRPQLGDAGEHTVTLQVRDTAGLSDTQSFIIRVQERNLPPSITSNPVVEAETQQEYSYQVAATDGNNDVLNFALGVFPDSMSINSSTGLIVWTPTSEQIGQHEITVVVSDPRNGSAIQNYTLIVREKNVAPGFTTINLPDATEDQSYRFTLEATDPNSEDSLIYSVISAPANLMVDAQTGEISWLPVNNHVGTQSLTFRVTDDNGLYQDKSFTIQVSNSNDAPVISSSPILSVEENVLYEYRVVASDVDVADTLNYSLEIAPVGMTITADSGVIQWLPDEDDIGVHSVEVNVRDLSGAFAEQSYLLEVAPSPNTLPVITSSPLLTATVGTSYQYTIIAEDADGDPLNYTLDTHPSGMYLTGRVIHWTPVDSQGGSSQIVTLEVSDGKGSPVVQSFLISVGQPTNQQPVITSSPDLSATVEIPYQYTIIASDADGDALNYTLKASPVGMTLTNNLLHWIPAANQVDSTYPVTIEVSDVKGAKATQSFTIAVNQSPNQQPVISSTPITTANVATPYQYTIIASDEDGDTLSYSLTTSPAGMSLNGNIINWTPIEEQGDSSQVVVIEVADNKGAKAVQSYVIAVNTPINTLPVITSLPPESVEQGEVYQYRVIATDADGDDITFGITTAPMGAVIDATGLIRWTPSSLQSGIHSFEVFADDGKGKAIQRFQVEVKSESSPLEVTLQQSATYLNEGEQLTITLVISGGEGNRSASLSINNENLPLDNSDSAVWTAIEAGQYEIEAVVTDELGSQTANSVVFVRDSSDTEPPIVILHSPTSNNEAFILNEPQPVSATIEDPNLVEWFVYLSPKEKAQWQTIAQGGNEINNAEITTIDPTMLTNGQYDLVLQAKDLNGAQSSDSVTLLVEGSLKVGNFSITYNDLDIQLAGLPIQVHRTYDSRRRNELLDFGYGWSIDYQNVKVEESRVLGKYWSLNEYPTGPLGLLRNYCVEPQGAPVVSVTLPNGDVEKFEAKVVSSCNIAVPILDVELKFEPVGDTQTKLVALNNQYGRFYNGDIVNTSDFLTPINPQRYKLTTRIGSEFYLDQNFGIEKVIEPNGAIMTYSDSGIVHSSGKSVTFERNSNGQITAITDPENNKRNYYYSETLDLQSSEDFLINRTQYGYNQFHGLVDIIDPLGNPVVKNIYDDTGRLIAQEDNEGNRTDFSHDIEGRQSAVTDKNGNTSFYYYDERGNVTNIVDALGNTTTYTYDGQDNQLTETDPLGNATTRTFNTNNDMLTETDAEGNVTTFTYNSRGQQLTVTDAKGNVYTSTYDAVGNLLTVTDPNSNLAGNNINGQGLVTLAQDSLGNQTTYEYDNEGNKTKETRPDGSISTYTYDNNNRLLTEARTRTDSANTELSEVNSFTYDALGRVLTETDGAGILNTYTYDVLGNVLTESDGHATMTHEYDVYNRLTRTEYSDGSEILMTYDPEGNLLTETDQNGNVTSHVYDALNRRISTAFADGNAISMTYDAAGRITSETDENGNVTTHTYDKIGRRLSSTDALGKITLFEYDANGNLTKQTDPLGRETTYTYDALDRRTQTTLPDGETLKDTFDALGRGTQKEDQLSRTIDYAYDSMGRLTTVTDVESQVTSYTYDEAGNKLTQTDALGRTTSWEYDERGRVTKRTLPLGQSETFTYDVADNMISHTNFNGEVIHYTYDNVASRLLTKKGAGIDESYTYDSYGNRLSATNSTGTYSYEYDSRHRLVKETQPNGTVLDYTYDGVGNKLTQTTTYPDTASVTTSYTYDASNQLVSVTDEHGLITRFEYDEVGNQTTITYPNGLVSRTVYDAMNRPLSVTTLDVNDTVLSHYTYGLDKTGRRTSLTDHTGREATYTYDTLYRLTNESVIDSTLGNYHASYTYDAVGNRTQSIINGLTTAYTYDDNDRLIQQGGKTYTYDSQGNQTEVSDGTTTDTYSYNANQELIAANKAGKALSFTYNPDGIRVSKTVDSLTTNFIVDSNRAYQQVIAELADDGSVNKAYTFGNDLISQTDLSTSDTSYFHYDGQGNTRNLSDTNGLSDSYTFDAFGTLLNTDGITDNDYLYSGEQFDAELDNYYLRARYYDQNVGRFTQMDEWMGKACTPITLNKYVYANADPIQYTDPTGFYSMADLQASMNVRQVLSTNSRGVQTVGFSYTKMKGKKSVTKAITCQVGVAYVKREYSRDRVHGHHPINKNLGGADNQSLIYLPANTHRMFHFVLHHVLLDEPAFRNMGNWTKKQNWNVISQSPAGRKALYKAILKASGMVDSYCGLKRKPTSLTNFVKKNRKHFVGNY